MVLNFLTLERKYTQEQKELLLDKLFVGVIHFDIYKYIEIEHTKRYISYYYPKFNQFSLSWEEIWNFFEYKKQGNYQEVKDLTQSILKDLTKRNVLTAVAGFYPPEVRT